MSYHIFMLTFRFPDLLELAGICSFAALDDDLPGATDRELHIIDWLGAAKVDQELLWVQPSSDPELLQVPKAEL